MRAGIRFLACTLICSLSAASLGLADGFNIFHKNTQPTRIAQGPGGKLYVSDPEANSVFIYDSGLNLLGELKGLKTPLGVAVDADGRIFVGVDGADRIEIYSKSGEIYGSIGEMVVDRPSDMALDLDGNLYVVDSAKDKVFVFDSAGEQINSFGSTGSGNGQFDFPVSITVDYELVGGTPSGEIYVVDQKNYRVQVFDLSGTFLRKFGIKVADFSSWNGRFNFAQSVAVDQLGRPHVIDSYLHASQIFHATTSAYLTKYGSFGTAPGELNLPLDIVCTDEGNIVAANTGNGRIEIIYSNAAPVVSLSANVVDEGASPGTLVGTFSTAPAPGSNTYMLVGGFGGEDNSLFSISGDELRVAGTIDFEEQGGACYIKVKNASSNSVNLMYGTELTIAINDLNDGPTNLVLERNWVLENQPSNTLVGYLQALDPDDGDTFTYAFATGAGGTDNARFSILGSMLLTDEIFDYETATNYSVRVSAQDSGGSAVTNSFSIAILNVGEVDDPDSDGDGMPDWWEESISGTFTGVLADADLDGDGASNLDEWIAATGAEDDSLVFEVESVQDVETNGYHTIRWRSYDGRVYGVDWSTNLMGAWVNLASNIPATPAFNVYTDTNHSTEVKGFYRVDVRLK